MTAMNVSEKRASWEKMMLPTEGIFRYTVNLCSFCWIYFLEQPYNSKFHVYSRLITYSISVGKFEMEYNGEETLKPAT